MKVRALFGFAVIMCGCVYGASLLLWRFTATASDHGYLLWIHDGDASPGGTITARMETSDVRLHGFSVAIGVESNYVAVTDQSGVDFAIQVPATCEADCVVELGSDRFSITREIHTHAPTVAILRRIARALFALAAALVAAALLAGATRWAFRRGKRMKWVWAVGAVVVLAGHFVFVSPAMAALGPISPWLELGLMTAWCALLFVPRFASLHRGLPRYEASPAILAGPADELPYRAVQHEQRTASADALLTALAGAGLFARRHRRELVVVKAASRAVIPISRAEIFTDEPFAIHATDDAVASAVIAAAASLLGPLHATGPSGRALTGSR